MKDFEFSIVPEVRFQDDYSVDEYMFDGVLSWEPVKFLKLAAAYRINTNIKNKADETTHRLAFDAQAKKELGRVEASLRARFTNYTDQADDAQAAGIGYGGCQFVRAVRPHTALNDRMFNTECFIQPGLEHWSRPFL